jgi:hypothetical protein
MKTKSFIFALFISIFTSGVFAQDRTTVTATNTDISDNLDLRAVASIFGDSRDLEDFERRLNDPKAQISNLDLNRDNQVDYLRVIESVEGNAHLIIIQSVLDREVFQDIATLEIERDSHNQVQVQVVGDVYMYGNNYIYEPVYVSRPIIYDYFWVNNYRPYYSSWYWGYYPSYYYVWAPYPIYTYRNHIHSHINIHHHYNYVNTRRSERAYALGRNYRANGYEVRNPGRSFQQRNTVANRYELDQVRKNNVRNNTTNPRSAVSGNVRSNTSTPRNTSANAQTTGNARPQTAATRGDSAPRSYTGTRSVTTNNAVRDNSSTTAQAPRTSTPNVQTRSETRTETTAAPRVYTPTRTQTASPASTPSARPQQTRSESPRMQPARSESPRISANQQSAPRSQSPAPQNNGGGRGVGRR